MIQDAFWGILIPFLGTSLGAGCVFFLKNSLRDGIQRALTGFAAGVMVAASVWSLLIPAMEQAADLGRLAFFPAAVGFWLGILFLLLLDHLIPHLHQNSLQAEGPKSQLQRTTMMVLAVTLHNIPEGMAVGVVYAGYLAGTTQITAAGALALSLGIAIPRSNVCGGGAKSPLWRKIFANVLGIPLDMVKTEQGPGYGAAMLAMVGCGKFASVQEAADKLVEVASTTEPDAALTAKYEARYQNFKKLYPALKDFFAATV